MLALELLAERRIEEALARGELDRLPGSGRPLVLDDDPLVPEELRVAHRILKNSGFVPPEVLERKEIAALERFVVRGEALEDAVRARAVNKLALLKSRVERAYYERVLRRLAG